MAGRRAKEKREVGEESPKNKQKRNSKGDL